MKLRHLVLPFLFVAVLLHSAPGAHAEWVWNKGTGWIDPLGLNPKVPDQRYKLAISMMMSGDYESSVKVFESILKEHPDSDLAEPCHFNIGQAYY
ncbi:MAG: hypothetical protein GY800_07950, partial [Planctomycetes bacterium]|nr:hypothetical protein [Planctomycetota bacterium]